MLDMLCEKVPKEAAIKIFTMSFGYPFEDDMPRLVPPDKDTFHGWTWLRSDDPALAWGDRFDCRYIPPPKPKWIDPSRSWGYRIPPPRKNETFPPPRTWPVPHTRQQFVTFPWGEECIFPCIMSPKMKSQILERYY
jgi:hypothetical protein